MHVGLGPIGAGVVRQVAERKGFRIVGAVDIDPAKAGRDLGEVAGVGRTLRVKVSADVKKAIKAAKPDVVVLCTSSSLKQVLAADGRDPEAAGADRVDHRGARVSDQAQPEVRAGDPRSSRRRRKVAVLGTGVNPGFVMDALPIMLTGVCERVQALRDRPRAGRPHPAAAVPAEDRRRADAASSSRRRWRTAACGTSGWRNRSR